MMRITNIITLSFVGLILAISASLAIGQKADDKTLYKWQDATGKWHYSKMPPQPSDLPPKKLEVAKDSKTIIFEEQQKTPDQKEQEVAQQQLRLKRTSCQSVRSNIKDVSFYLRQTNDKEFQEKNITLEEYEQTKKFITKLEDISSDTNFNDICVDDFSKEPQTKAISNCIVEQTTLETRGSCLKELSTF
ncbi:hypothetical protein DKL61_14985 [Gammaproteobacteria bacterium ESL0073]|nr:hypothetical protein DKL61_14985 [Gammaproteobacteria bacterium ESL0073]